jgi:hypothetical protein
VDLYLNSFNTPSRRGAQLKNRDNFTFYLYLLPTPPEFSTANGKAVVSQFHQPPILITYFPKIRLSSSHLLCLSTSRLPKGLPTEITYVLLFSPILATSSAHLSPLDFTVLRKLSNLYKSQSSSQINILILT